MKDIMENVPNVTWKRKRMNNTVEYGCEDGSRKIRLHDTDIITYKPNGDIVLNSNGWQTVTTKDRMNRFLNEGNIYQSKSVWYLTINGDEYVYQDGITIHPDRSVSNAGKQDDLKKIQKQIKKYVDEYCEELFSGRMGPPDGGDCWFCLMFKEMGGNEHLLSHMKEKYYVPSIVVNALEDCGASQAAQLHLAHCFGMGERVEWAEGIASEQIKKSITRYLRRQLGLAK